MPKTKTSPSQTDQLTENWKRALADYQNLLRRVEAEKKLFARIANANLIARLLPSLDVLELAASHSQDTGVTLAAKEFHDALVQEGLSVIKPQVGDAFSPSFHDCTEALIPPSDAQQNSIAELVLKGYRLGDLVLRPARVKVYKSTENSSINSQINT